MAETKQGPGKRGDVPFPHHLLQPLSMMNHPEGGGGRQAPPILHIAGQGGVQSWGLEDDLTQLCQLKGSVHILKEGRGGKRSTNEFPPPQPFTNGI